MKSRDITKIFRRISNKKGMTYGILYFLNYVFYKLFRIIHLPGGYVWPYITDVQVEPTKKCDMKCTMCTNTYLRKDEKGNMSYENFLKIMNQFPFVRDIKLHGLGEIMLNKDIIKMIKYCKGQGMAVNFNSNASLLTDEIIKELLENELDCIRFSLDTLDEEKYIEIRGVNKLKKVKSNIEKFAKTRNENEKYKGTKLEITMVTLDNNLIELPAMIEYAGKIGIYNVNASLAKMKASSNVQSKVVKNSTSHISMNEEADEIKKKALDKANELGVKLHFLRNEKKNALNCKWPWKKVYVTYDGYITPCCHLEDPKVFNFGNILETPFLKLWNGKKYREFRKNFFDWNSICKKCPHISGDIEEKKVL